MSDSSEDDAPFQLRDLSDDSDGEGRPTKRRRTAGQPVLRAKGLGFISAGAQPTTDDEREENESEDERPSMGLGMGGFRNDFNIGEFNGERVSDSPSPRLDEEEERSQVHSGRGPSAFSAGGKMNKSSFAARMLAKQGYVAGQGLGKSGQGITAPIQTQMLQNRAGLGHGSTPDKPARTTKAKTERGKLSGTGIPGTSTPKIKAPPKKKYEIASIESRGLHIPAAMKSIIIDATGTETRTVSSLSGVNTPTNSSAPPSEAAKAAARIKLQLQAYADAWDATKEQEMHLDGEEEQMQASIQVFESNQFKYLDVISSFERVSVDDSQQGRDWLQIVQRLQDIQDKFADDIEELDLTEMTAACLDGPMRRELVDWDPLAEPDRMVTSIQSIGALLELEKSVRSRHRKRMTPFESLLSAHWFPRVRGALKDWDVYDPEKAVVLLTLWTPVLAPWLVYRVMHEIIIPKLMEAIRRFPKLLEGNPNHPTVNGSGTSSSKNRRAAPPLHSWLFDWWSLLSSDELDLERFSELRSLVKSKVDSESWPTWKPLLGSKRAPPVPRNPASIPSTNASTPAATIYRPVDEMSFKEIFDEWCAENDLVLRSSQKADSLGRLLYRLQDAERRSRGILVYIQEDIVFGEDGTPYGLDNALVNAVTRR